MKPFREYQHLPGEPLTERDKTEVGSKFWNEGKWDNFVLPLLPLDCHGLTFVEMGCNAGLFLKLAQDKGFKTVVGVDSDVDAIQRGCRWRDANGGHYRFIRSKMEESIEDLPVADYTVLVNAHYYFSIDEWLKYLDRLQYKTRYCIIVTTEKRPGNRCWAQADVENVRKYFKTWEETGFVDAISTEGDPRPRKLYGLCFKSPFVERVSIDSLDSGNHVQDEFYKEIDQGIAFNKTKYYKILKPYRKNWTEEELDSWIVRKINLYRHIENFWITNPLIISSDNLILDGNHRCQMLKHLGNKEVLVRRI